MSKLEIWKRTDSEEIADCRIFKIRKDNCIGSETNKKASFFVIENPDWVNIIALTKRPENSTYRTIQTRL